MSDLRKDFIHKIEINLFNYVIDVSKNTKTDMAEFSLPSLREKYSFVIIPGVKVCVNLDKVTALYDDRVCYEGGTIMITSEHRAEYEAFVKRLVRNPEDMK